MMYWCNLLPHVVNKLLTAPAIPDGYRHRPLGLVLAHDVPFRFRNNLPRRQVRTIISPYSVYSSHIQFSV